MRKSMCIVAATVFLILLGCSGSSGLDELFGSGDTICLDESPDLEGTWVITGSGKRSNCADETLNTDRFELQSAPVALKATEDGAGNLQFELAAPLDDFVLDGAVDCEEVMFSTREQYRGETLQHIFSGAPQTGGVIAGTFTGTGPDACTSSGSFQMVRQ